VEAGAELEAFRVPAPRGLVVMSQNIYVGTDVDAVIGALTTSDPNDDVPALVAAVATLNETDFTARAAGFAEEVRRFRPDVIGLVEVSRIDVDLDLTPLGSPHIVAHEDFLPELTAALRRQHLHYRVAAVNQNFVVAPITGVSLTDYDVTLVAAGVQVGHDVTAKNFDANVGPVAPGVSLTYGFTSVPVKVAGRRYVVATTHLQDDVGPADLTLLRAAQMQELVAAIPADHPAVILGDLNDFAGTPMHQVATGAGFVDVWPALRPGQDGFTCCHASDLTDTRIPNQRIDYVFARGFGHHDDPIDGWIFRFGLLPREMVQGPLHPIFISDHIGLVARLAGRHH
jgi:endonuclease/exonuclease/phosphatase family metal-dependent hydrolase